MAVNIPRARYLLPGNGRVTRLQLIGKPAGGLRDDLTAPCYRKDSAQIVAEALIIKTLGKLSNKINMVLNVGESR